MTYLTIPMNADGTQGDGLVSLSLSQARAVARSLVGKGWFQATAHRAYKDGEGKWRPIDSVAFQITRCSDGVTVERGKGARIRVAAERVNLWTGFRHDCDRVGDVELSEDWRYCPWCGRGLTKAKERALGELGE